MLEIKCERLINVEQLHNVRVELDRPWSVPTQALLPPENVSR
jgi:hypothetical protein